MSTHITTNTDYQTLLQQKLSERIRANFVELLPVEQFDSMVAAAMDEFQNGPRSKRFKKVRRYAEVGDAGYCPDVASVGQTYAYFEDPILDNPYQVHSDSNTLPGMIYAELKMKASAELAKLLETPEYAGIFGTSVATAPSVYTKTLVDGALKTMLTENAGLFVQQMLSGVINNAVLSTVNHLRNNAGARY